MTGTDVSFTKIVMAHESRKKYFPYLERKLNPIFSIDDGSLGTWGNRRRCLEIGLKANKDYTIIIQDDAIVCDDFDKRVEERLKLKGVVYLFLPKRASNNFNYNQKVIESRAMGGVATAIPTKMIKDLIYYCDRIQGPDDTRLRRYFEYKGLNVKYPLPCLIDHRDDDSLVGNGFHSKFTPRKAVKFIDHQHFPKIIHQIWIGEKTPPKRLMDTWKMRGWEYKLWDEKQIDKLNLTNQDKYDYYYNKNIYHGAADVARAEILYKHGGMYVDADSKRLRALEGEFLYSQFFAVKGNPKKGVAPRIANGVMGATPKHYILKEYIKNIGEAEELEPAWDTIGGTMLTRILKGNQDPMIKILEPYWFYPFGSNRIKHPKWRKALAEHYWGSKNKGVYG